MQHVIKKLAILNFSLMTLANISQVYADGIGSYLYCVKEGKEDRKYAHWSYDDPANLKQKIDLSQKYPDVKRKVNMHGLENMVWIEGTRGAVGGQSTLSVEAYDDADEVCKLFAKVCTDEYGPNYKYVGAGEGSVKGWNGISIYTRGNSGDKDCRCRNWDWNPRDRQSQCVP